jgi:hypothetical protein
MKTKYLTCLMLLAVACSGGQTTGGDQGGQSTAQLKKAAAEAHANGTAKGDVCGAEGWYGDGECDTFCQDADATDCGCLLILETPNGRCDRRADDPCISQDPDCVPSGVHPTPGDPGTPLEPIICPAIVQLPDGVCRPDPSDPCVFYEDPDCNQTGAGGSGAGGSSAGGSSAGGSSPGGGASGGTPMDPPGVVCAEYIEEPDGICKRDPKDPCIFQDPDCDVK